MDIAGRKSEQVHMRVACDGIIYSIIPDANGNIYTAGQFTNAAGKFYVAKWNGSDWSEVGTGTGTLNANSNINSLAIDAGGNLYAAGNFRDVSGYQYVAEWNGSSWNELGTGSAALNANDMINVIAFDAAGRLNAAGMFSDANGSYYLAQWLGNSWTELQGTNRIWPVTNYIFSRRLRPLRKCFCRGDFTDPMVTVMLRVFRVRPGRNPACAAKSNYCQRRDPMHAMAEIRRSCFCCTGQYGSGGCSLSRTMDRYDLETGTRYFIRWLCLH